jgi:hypothetical protein
MKDTSYIKILTLKNQSNVDKKTIEIKKKKKKKKRERSPYENKRAFSYIEMLHKLSFLYFQVLTP